MKVKLYFQLLILLITIPMVRPNLSIEEQQDVLSTCLVSPALKQVLDGFFAQKDIREYMAISKRFIFPWGNNRLTKASLDQKGAYVKNVLEREAHRVSLLAALVSKYHLKCYQGLQVGDTSTIISLNGFVLKIPNASFPMYPQIYGAYKLGTQGRPGLDQNFEKIILTKTRYQNVSRVFMAIKIYNFIESEHLQLIHVPHSYLYPLSTAPSDQNLVINGDHYPEVIDDNYIVVEEEIPNLTSEAENKGFVISMINKGVEDYANFVKPEYSELLTQLVQVITYAGLWDVSSGNVFAVRNPGTGALSFVLTDLEKPGLGGSDEVNFFHKNKQEIVKNSIAGLDGLCDWLNKQ